MPNKYALTTTLDWFEVPPNSTKELERWWDFREAYHAAEKLELPPFPLQIDFELNSTCQMKCGFCLHGHEKVQKKFLTFEQFCRIIDEGAQNGLCSIKLNYINEPLLNRDLPLYVDYARSKGVLNVYFATNGLLLTEQTAQRLIDAKVSKIMVSLDAATPETFLKMRGSKHYNLIVQNIRRFLELRGDGWPKLRVNFLETPINEHEAEAFISQWEGVADLLAMQKRLGVPGQDSGDFWPGEDFHCSTPFKLCVVDSAGYILPCCAFGGREMPLGHSDEMTIAEAWNSERMNALRDIHRQGRYTDNPICAHCVGSCK
jgi:radical SAM protein with 4Fe4S-binding SPASM domain